MDLGICLGSKSKAVALWLSEAVASERPVLLAFCIEEEIISAMIVLRSSTS